jgi:hypothetical protein
MQMAAVPTAVIVDDVYVIFGFIEYLCSCWHWEVAVKLVVSGWWLPVLPVVAGGCRWFPVVAGCCRLLPVVAGGCRWLPVLAVVDDIWRRLELMHVGGGVSRWLAMVSGVG